MIECLCSPNYNLKKKDTPNVYFVGNGLSGDALYEVMELIGGQDFSVNVISKVRHHHGARGGLPLFPGASGGKVRRRRCGPEDLRHHGQSPGCP